MGTQAQAVGGDSFQKLIEIGIALSAEHDHDRLMEKILLEAKDMCNADGGTLYLRTDDDELKFEIMRTDSLNIAMGGTTGKAIEFPPLPMYAPGTGEPNERNIATYAALNKQPVNIPDAYEADHFDFSGTKKFDEGTGYRSQSFLTVPLANHEGDVIGVLQLLNARDGDGTVIAFSQEIEPLIEALASQAAVALDNEMLLEAQKKLFDSFIKVIASAIDAKSPYTGGHCERVPELARMLAEAAQADTDGPFKDFALNDDEWNELRVGAWLHDCGKVTTPEYVVDKATKLETIYNRIHEVRTRFEVVKRDKEIEYLKAVMAGGDEAVLKADFDAAIIKLDEDYAFVAECNEGGEFMAPEKMDRLKEIAQATWQRTLDDRIGLSHGEMTRIRSEPQPLPAMENLLSDKPDHVIPREKSAAIDNADGFGFKMDVPENQFNLGEVYNLSVARGTLTEEERYQINEHIVQTIIMLEQLPFPKNLSRVPDYAGAHHETMIGTGYPRKLVADDMTIPARIMAIADIFEALTAADRPYKKPKSLSDSVKILSFFKKDQHIDGELFDLFLTSGVFMDYAKKYLGEDQLDDVDIRKYVAQAAE